MAALDAAHGALERRRAVGGVRIIFVTADGQDFCARHELKELTAACNQDKAGRAFFVEPFGKCSRLTLEIVRCQRPVIGEVLVISTATGCQVMTSCYLAVASRGIRFALPWVNTGSTCSTPMGTLPHNLGRKHAMRMYSWIKRG
jgi:enoyl-CoA hydratase/carnithine racemase